MSNKCTVYIDEAGDLGINRGTQWFVLTAVIINKDAELIGYINKLINYPENEISGQFTGICSKSAESCDMLQLADICATSMFYYHEINSYGFLLPCYTYKLRKLLYQRNGSANKYGINYYSADMKPDNTYFTDHMVCK